MKFLFVYFNYVMAYHQLRWEENTKDRVKVTKKGCNQDRKNRGQIEQSVWVR